MVFKTDISSIVCNTEQLNEENNASTSVSVNEVNLPNVLPVFELPYSVLMPKTQLPLSISNDNFFSVLSNLMDSKTIAVMPLLQPGRLQNVGCAGKIQDVQVGNDEIKLVVQGICRFNVLENITSNSRSLRRVKVLYDKYKRDICQTNDSTANYEQLLVAIEKYFKMFSIDRNWSVIKNISPSVLVSTITMAFPFHPLEKQLILETVSVEEQCNMIIKIIEMDKYKRFLTPMKTIN